jgi:hypothetical protein
MELAEAGLRRALLAGWARSLGLVASAEEIAAAEEEWWRSLRVRPPERAKFLSASGLDAPSARRLFEERALERLMLAHAQRVLPDGPSWEEALASEARLRGRWAEVVRELAQARRPLAR